MIHPPMPRCPQTGRSPTTLPRDGAVPGCRPRRQSARATRDYVFCQLIPYLGSKRRLLDLIAAAVAATRVRPDTGTFVDVFAGSGVVARWAKQLGFAVVANDWEPYSRVLNTAALSCNDPPPLAALGGYAAALAALDALPGEDGWVATHLCPADDAAPDPTRERLFYRRATGRRIDAIRGRIAAWQAAGLADEAATACLLAPLLFQASWLANTSGVFKGFHAGWGGRNRTALHRILADLRLAPLVFQSSRRPQRVLTVDALQLQTVLGSSADIAYVDPPYNQHPYASNYHVLNSIVLWDRPELPPPTARGHKAAIRADWRARQSPFNSRRHAGAALAMLLDRLDATHVLVSYSTDGLIPVERLVAIAAAHGRLSVHCRPYKRYRVSPTRPSPRPRNVEFVLRIDRRTRCSRADADGVLASVRAGLAATL